MGNNIDIFNYIYPKENDSLKSIKGEDLQKLLVLLDDYKLELRNDTNINPDVTMGLELEIEHFNRSNLVELYDNLPSDDWDIAEDLSLKDGIEVTSPILTDQEKSWEELTEACNYLKTKGKISSNTAGHIHIGAHILKDNSNNWLNLLKIWSVYENIIFRFSYGEFLNGRPSQKKYAHEVKKQFEDDYKTLLKCRYDVFNMLRIIKQDRNQAINFENIYPDKYNLFLEKNTIEIRCPNGTLNPIIWQNNANFFVKLLSYCNNSNFDYGTIFNREEKNNKLGIDYTKYNAIYLEQALELADLVFDNNKDKVYFLRQYFKSFDIVNNNHEKLVKAKVFTR